MRTALRTIILAIREWLPSELFRQSEVGVWYDPSDFSTMYQDSAGTTPVTAVEQPVGLLLDKSKGLVLGAELVTNGDFSNGTTGWTARAGKATISVVSGELEVVAIAADAQVADGLSFPSTSGRLYRVTGTMRSAATNIAANSARVATIGTTVYAHKNVASNGTQTPFDFIVTATASSISLELGVASLGVWGTSGDKAYFDNISVKELPGQHSKQAAAAARPVLKATPTRIDYDAVDDTLVATFASSLGTDCTVCRAVPSVGASILTAQTIGTTYTDNTDHCGLIIVNRALTASETSSVTAYLNAKAGV